jgi:hypothetical protein
VENIYEGNARQTALVSKLTYLLEAHKGCLSFQQKIDATVDDGCMHPPHPSRRDRDTTGTTTAWHEENPMH